MLFELRPCFRSLSFPFDLNSFAAHPHPHAPPPSVFNRCVPCTHFLTYSATFIVCKSCSNRQTFATLPFQPFTSSPHPSILPCTPFFNTTIFPERTPQETLRIMAMTSSNRTSNYSHNSHQHMGFARPVLASCYATSKSCSTGVQGFHYSSTGADGMFPPIYYLLSLAFTKLSLFSSSSRGTVAFLRPPRDIRQVLLTPAAVVVMAPPLVTVRGHRESSQRSVRDCFVET